MAIITLNGAAELEIIIDGQYKESGVIAIADDGITDVSSDVETTTDLDLGTAGAYTVTYTLPANITGDEFEVALEVVETRTVNVIAKDLVAPMGNVDTTFDLGDEDRTGTDTSGTYYDVISDDQRGRRDHSAPDNIAAHFDEGSLDPYEVKHSR